MMMDKTCICGCQATEKHHIIFRSQMQPLEKCEMNMIYLCMECHRGTNGVHGKNGHVLDNKLKKKFQEDLTSRLLSSFDLFGSSQHQEGGHTHRAAVLILIKRKFRLSK